MFWKAMARHVRCLQGDGKGGKFSTGFLKIYDAQRAFLPWLQYEKKDHQVGEYISRKIISDGWGKSTITNLSAFVQAAQPGIRGFSPQNLWRMRQFYETYRNQSILSPLLRELPWSSNLHILSRAKRPEEREFYDAYSLEFLGLPDDHSEAEYEIQLPDKRLLQAKLHEFYQLLAPVEDSEAPVPPRKPRLRAVR